MVSVRRRSLLSLLFLGVPPTDAAGPVSLRGRLVSAREGKPALETAAPAVVFLEGDKDTTGVLLDPRLQGEDFEAQGRFVKPSVFEILPIHLRAMFVHRNGKKFLITYWCEVCAIRRYTPGVCPCCQEEMALDLQPPVTP